MKKKLIIFFLFIITFIGLGVIYVNRINIQDWYFEYKKQPLPQTTDIQEIKNDNNILEEINLNIPFQSQAPHANWDMPYQEGCEEASIILAINYLEGVASLTANEMDTEILNLVDWQNKNWGGHHDLTIEQTAELLEKYYNNKFQTEIIYDFTWNQVKQNLNNGWPIIVPAAGRELSNPYYTQPGPVYHMLVIKGYTPEVIITNDPGTKKGADYQYDYDVLFNAIHNWNDGDVNDGEKAMIIIKK